MSIRVKVIAAFLTVSLCGIVLVGYFSFQFAKEQLIFVRGEKLTAIVSNQKQDLTNILVAWKDRVRLIASRTQLRLSFRKHLDTPEDAHLNKMKKILRDAIGAVRKVEHISMYDLKGNKVVEAGKYLAAYKMFEGTSFKVPETDLLEHVWRESDGQQLYVSLIGPLLAGNQKVGVIQVILKADELLEIVKNYNGLGKSGETLIAKNSAQGFVHYITPLRFEKTGSTFRVPSNQLYIPANLALAKKETLLLEEQIVDYRGVPVFAATGYLPELKWGIVVKIDRAEVFEVINRLFNMIVGLVIILGLVTAFVGFHFSNQITQPILALTRIEEKVREGDWSLRAEVNSKDEIGQLAEIFNEMLSSLSDKTIELEEFVFRSAHDLRSPLVSCIGLLKYIKEDIRSGERERALEKIESIRSALSESETLICDLLALTKLKNSEEPSELLNISDLIDNALNKFRHMKNFNRLDIRKDIQFIGDLITKKSRITLVIDNLISNAVKYQDLAEEQSYLKVSLVQDGDHIILEVADNGLGIPKDQQEKIFSMFERFHPTTSFGSGLGLYMMKKSADLLKGEIQYRDPGKGTVFSLRVPYTV